MCSGSWRAGTEGAGQAGGFQKPEEARENSNETCILSYVKYIASPGSMYETGYSGQVHWDDSERWDREGGGRGFRMGDTCTPMANSCQCMAKTTTIL